jgi:predicted transposase YbfD/YdcC
MNSTILPCLIKLPDHAFSLDVAALTAQLATLPDRRKRRGVRYPLAVLLAIAVLAKLAGQNQARAIADWARLRTTALTQLFGLPHPRMPHATTWSRLFAVAVDPQAFDQVVTAWLVAQRPHDGTVPVAGSIPVALDGKTLRGTIPAGTTHGTHLVALYRPDRGLVLTQRPTGAKANELTIAPQVLADVDLVGTVVTGDAMFAQRTLSAQIVEADGDYLWLVKANQRQLRDDLELLFGPEFLTPGWSAPPLDLRIAAQVTKAHGRLELRTITVSSDLAGYSDWPYLEQVFKLEGQRWERGRWRKGETWYGITSLRAAEASADRLLHLKRGHWGIETGLHGRRDVTLQEDRSQLRMGQAAIMNASLNNLVIGLTVRDGRTNLPSLRRAFAYEFDYYLHHIVPQAVI